MSIRKIISLPRGDIDLDVEVSAEAVIENRRVYLRGFRADEDLSPAEREMAEEELIDRALCRR